jgi:Flp pilus assembly protein TadG
LNRIKRTITDFRDEQQGQILIITAVSLVALLGIAALSIDASFMYEKRNRLHAAADAAAKSAAYEVHRNPTISSTDLGRFVNHEVTAFGFSPSACGATTGTAVCVNRPPSSGPFAADSTFVETILAETTSTYFGRVLGWITARPGARAVAGAAGTPTNCFVTSDDLTLGNTTLTLNNCGAGVGGDLHGENPNSTIGGTPTPAVAVTGTCDGTCGHMGALLEGSPAPIDPLASLPAFAPPATCPPPPYPLGSSATLTPGCYSGVSTAVHTLNAGEYYITGTVNIDTLTGTNVFLYLAGTARLHSANNKSLTLTARTTGAYSGIAIFQERGNLQNFDTGNNFTLSINGALYFPSADVDFPNSLNFVQTGCTLFVAKSLSIRNGNGSMSNSGCSASFGGALFLAVGLAE